MMYTPELAPSTNMPKVFVMTLCDHPQGPDVL